MIKYMLNAYYYARMLRRRRDEKLTKKILRDTSDPTNVPDELFLELYNIKRNSFEYLMFNIEEEVLRRVRIPARLQVLLALRFLGKGKHQRANVCLGKRVLAKVMRNVVSAINTVLYTSMVLENGSKEKRQCTKKYFEDKMGLSSIVGCVAFTHIEFIKPTELAFMYENEFGTYSIKTLIVCDENTVIHAVDARHQGSYDDSYIWQLCSSSCNFLKKYQQFEPDYEILADNNFTATSHLVVPHKNVQAGSKKETFNQSHAEAYNVAERTINAIKNRFTCLASTMKCRPQNVTEIIKACCILHNIGLRHIVPRPVY